MLFIHKKEEKVMKQNPPEHRGDGTGFVANFAQGLKQGSFAPPPHDWRCTACSKTFYEAQAKKVGEVVRCPHCGSNKTISLELKEYHDPPLKPDKFKKI